MVCLSSVRHDDIKVIFDVIATLYGSEGTIAAVIDGKPSQSKFMVLIW